MRRTRRGQVQNFNIAHAENAILLPAERRATRKIVERWACLETPHPA